MGRLTSQGPTGIVLRVLITGEPLDEWPSEEMVDRLPSAHAAPRKS